MTRRVVVVGGGPAGLEAARVAAERGHSVTVLEAASQAGGQARLAALNPRRRESGNEGDRSGPDGASSATVGE
jgi:NADPH-dependent 2,4-dienoyl-CoA reductase/sulfur reductase-like enzyme